MRFGELSLRQQRFTQPMLNTLRTENVQTRMSLVDEDDSVKGIGSTGFMYSTVANKRVHLVVNAQNMSSEPLVLLNMLETDQRASIRSDACSVDNYRTF